MLYNWETVAIKKNRGQLVVAADAGAAERGEQSDAAEMALQVARGLAVVLTFPTKKKRSTKRVSREFFASRAKEEGL